MISLNEIWQAIEGRVLALIHKSEARGVRVIRTTVQSIPDSSVTSLAFDTVIKDSEEGACWDAGEPTRLVAGRSGYYIAGGTWGMTSSANTAACLVAVLIRVNGGDYVGRNYVFTLANEDVFVSATSGMIWLNEGDYIQIRAYHKEGAAKNTAAGSVSSQDCVGWLMRVG